VEGDDPITAPSHSHWTLFQLFLGFGFRAWGGPMAQIAMIQEELVTKQKWISLKRFNRVLAVYQALPGPEATELCCYFGMISRGRMGSLISGFAFILPGFILMLLLSYIYLHHGIQNAYFLASFRGIQPAVAAMVCRAVHKLGGNALIDHESKRLDPWLLALACVTAIASVLRVTFIISLVVCGIIYSLHKRNHHIAVVAWSIACILAYALVVAYVSSYLPSLIL
jgi:putative chromate ion transporter